MDLLSGMQVEMTKVTNIRENHRGSPFLNQLSTVGEGIPSLAWVTYDTKPTKFINEMIGAARFYGDRVLREHKMKYVARAGMRSKRLTLVTPAGIPKWSNGSDPTTTSLRHWRST